MGCSSVARMFVGMHFVSWNAQESFVHCFQDLLSLLILVTFSNPCYDEGAQRFRDLLP